MIPSKARNFACIAGKPLQTIDHVARARRRSLNRRSLSYGTSPRGLIPKKLLPAICRLSLFTFGSSPRFSVCRRYGTKCSGCLQGISPQDLVRKARDKVFHLNCFTCLVCRKQMSTGEELYVLDDNKFVCKQDYLSGKPLPDTHHVHGHHGELQVSLSLVIHRGGNRGVQTRDTHDHRAGFVSFVCPGNPICGTLHVGSWLHVISIVTAVYFREPRANFVRFKTIVILRSCPVRSGRARSGTCSCVTTYREHIS